MRALRLSRVRRALIVAPHSDDETIGAFGLIQALQNLRAEVCVLVVTDGTASHRNSLRWSPRDLAWARRSETRRVLGRLGVPAGAIEFLDLPDGGLRTLSLAEEGRVVSAIIRSHADLLVLPRSDDDHPDHQVVAALAARAPLRARRISYLVWPSIATRSVTSSRQLRVLPGPGAKRWALRGYRTQTGLIQDDPHGFEIDDAQRARFARPFERFAPVR